VHLLSLVYKSVVLGDPLEGEFVHQVDLIGFSHESVFEIFDCDGECGRKQENLSFFWQKLKFVPPAVEIRVIAICPPHPK